MKICKVETCTSPVFSHLYCKWHQYLREDLKNKPRPYQKKPVKPELSFGFDNQMEMFLTLWSNAKDINANVVCPYTGEKLNQYHGKQAFWSCFLHVIPKGRYPLFKLNPANIRIASPIFHRIVDQGTMDERKQHPDWKWDLWDKEVIEMKVEYQKFKKDNLFKKQE